MLTPQEVSTHSFTRAMMGGYNMSMVDGFLDQLTEDYTALYKENTALKAKLKVLVEKVEEYRATEDSMRATLLTAQKMADSIVRDAEARRDEILKEAENRAQEKIDEYRRELAETEMRLSQGREELARFITVGRQLCEQELAFLEKLPYAPVEKVAPNTVEETPAEQEIEEKVMATFSEEDAPASVGEVDSAEEEAKSEPIQPALEVVSHSADAVKEPEPALTPQDASNSFVETNALDATRRIELDGLKFGRNYDKE